MDGSCAGSFLSISSPQAPDPNDPPTDPLLSSHHILPGPTPTLIISAPERISSSTISPVTTFPAWDRKKTVGDHELLLVGQKWVMEELHTKHKDEYVLKQLEDNRGKKWENPTGQSPNQFQVWNWWARVFYRFSFFSINKSTELYDFRTSGHLRPSRSGLERFSDGQNKILQRTRIHKISHETLSRLKSLLFIMCKPPETSVKLQEPKIRELLVSSQLGKYTGILP